MTVIGDAFAAFLVHPADRMACEINRDVIAADDESIARDNR